MIRCSERYPTINGTPIIAILEIKNVPLDGRHVQSTLEVSDTVSQIINIILNFVKSLFKTTNISIINDCRLYFGTKPPSELLLKRRQKFLVAYNSSSDNFLWKMYNA